MSDDFPTLINQQRGYLLRIAQLQLRDSELAQNIVQETLLAALEGQSNFAGKSSVKTWLTSILKHKVIDAIRRKSRELSLADLQHDESLDDLDVFFNEDDKDHWHSPPAEWRDPSAALQQKQFVSTLESCLERMPPNAARIFTMREVFEMESEEICKEMSITSTNLWVILYRARMLLRQCLEEKWFTQPGATR